MRWTRPSGWQVMVHVLWAAWLLLLADAGPASAAAFFYALTRGGDLIRYDPDTDHIVRTPAVARGYVGPSVFGNPFGPSEQYPRTRVLDMARKRLVVLSSNTSGPVIIDLQKGTTRAVRLLPLGYEFDRVHLIYPRQASRFYVWWPRESDPSGRSLGISMLTAIGLDGRVLQTRQVALTDFGWSTYRSDGRSFYTTMERTIHLMDAETLGTLRTLDLQPFKVPDAIGPGLREVQGGRVLLTERMRAPKGEEGRLRAFTVDEALRLESASPRIDGGFDVHAARLVPGGKMVLLQEAIEPGSAEGGGRLHLYDARTAAPLGLIEFPVRERADLLGFHPDGRRLFIRDWEVAFSHRGEPTSQSAGIQTWLIIVDLVSRSVVRVRPFEPIETLSDFAEEP